MALSFLDNVDYRGKKPNFTRDLFDTVADMAAFNENYLPDVFLACNKEGGKVYVYNRDNSIDATLGKWREIEGGSGVSSWEDLIGKPFKDIDGTVFTVDENGVLSVVIPEVPIETISVNGELVEPVDKNIDIEIPEIPIETISVNGVTVEPMGKNVNIEIPEFEQLTEDDIYDMLGLSEEELEGLANLISDTEVRLDKTYSSSKIYTDIIQCLEDSKTYTLEQIARASTASYKVAASTDEMVDTKYIYLLAVDDTYDLYIFDEDSSSAIKIGETEIDLSGYYTKEEVDEAFVLNTAFELVAQSIGDVETLKTTSKVIVDAINEIYDKFDEGGLGGNAEDIGYDNESFPDYTNVDLALTALFNKVYYVKPTCSLSASKTGGNFEMGTTITAPITFTWTTNKPITSQTLTGFTLDDATVRTATYETDITSDKTFTLSVSDGENSATSSVSYKFMNNVFWGSSPIGTYDSAFINALSSKKLTTSVKGTYSFNVATGEYGFWAVPSNMTISTVWIGGFEVTVESCGTVSYENSQGYTRDYNIYKTGQSGLGSISAEIK